MFSPSIGVAIELPAASSPYMGRASSFTPDPFRLLTSPRIDRRRDPSELADGHKRRPGAHASRAPHIGVLYLRIMEFIASPSRRPTLLRALHAHVQTPEAIHYAEVACRCHSASTARPDSDDKARPRAEHGSHWH